MMTERQQKEGGALLGSGNVELNGANQTQIPTSQIGAPSITGAPPSEAIVLSVSGHNSLPSGQIQHTAELGGVTAGISTAGISTTIVDQGNIIAQEGQVVTLLSGIPSVTMQQTMSNQIHQVVAKQQSVVTKQATGVRQHESQQLSTLQSVQPSQIGIPQPQIQQTTMQHVLPQSEIQPSNSGQQTLHDVLTPVVSQALTPLAPISHPVAVSHPSSLTSLVPVSHAQTISETLNFVAQNVTPSSTTNHALISHPLTPVTHSLTPSLPITPLVTPASHTVLTPASQNPQDSSLPTPMPMSTQQSVTTPQSMLTQQSQPTLTQQSQSTLTRQSQPTLTRRSEPTLTQQSVPLSQATSSAMQNQQIGGVQSIQTQITGHPLLSYTMPPTFLQ